MIVTKRQTRLRTTPRVRHLSDCLNAQLVMPLYDEGHYTIKEPLADADALRQLIGQPVLAKTKYGTNIGCLIKVDGESGTLFNAGDGYMGTSSFQIKGSEVGRAWHLS